MNERDSSRQQQPDAKTENTPGRRRDDRRQEVKPTDKAVPRSPEPEHEAVRAGEEKLERVKAY